MWNNITIDDHRKLQSSAKVAWLFLLRLPWTPTKAILGYVTSINLHWRKKRPSLTLLSAGPPQCYERRPFRGRQRVCRVEPFVIQQLGRSRRPAVEKNVTSTRIKRKTINWNIAPTTSIPNPIDFRYLPKKMVRGNHVSGCQDALFECPFVFHASWSSAHLLSKVSNIHITFTTGNLWVWTWSIMKQIEHSKHELLLQYFTVVC